MLAEKFRFTRKLKEWACWAWCGGLAVIALDFLYLPLGLEKASLSYLFFSLAGLLVVWSEKREYGTRVFLYRIHDSIFHTPWKYLVFYFLWICIFSSFLGKPMAATLYALNGWLSLLAVGITAYFLFVETTLSGLSILIGRLRVALKFFCVTVLFLFCLELAQIAFARSFHRAFILPSIERLNFFFYFLIGMPYLAWDLLRKEKRMLPVWLLVVTLFAGTMEVVIVGRWIYFLTFSFVLALLFLLYFWKQRARKFPYLFFAVAAGFLFFLFLLLIWNSLPTTVFWQRIAGLQGDLEAKMKNPYLEAVALLWNTRFLGVGIGQTGLRGVWVRVIAEGGLIGFVFYFLFFTSILHRLYRVKKSEVVSVTHITFISVFTFLTFGSHFIANPYGAYVWVWYSIWVVFGLTDRRKLDHLR